MHDLIQLKNEALDQQGQEVFVHLHQEQMRVEGLTLVQHYLKGVAKGSLPTIRSTLTMACRWLFGHEDFNKAPWHLMTGALLQAVAAKLREDGYKPRTCRKYIAILRSLVHLAMQYGFAPQEQCQRALIERIKFGTSIPHGRALSVNEEREVNETLRADQSVRAVRDMAIFTLMRYCGLRRAEVTSLLLSSVDMQNGRILVTGKGAKERAAYLPPGTMPVIQSWLDIRGDEHGPLFVGIWPRSQGYNPIRTKLKDGERGPLKPISTAQVNHLVKVRLEGMPSVAPASPHDFRRTFATRRLRNGDSLAHVQRLMGHASQTTTAIYVKLDEDDLKNSAANDKML